MDQNYFIFDRGVNFIVDNDVNIDKYVKDTSCLAIKGDDR